MRDKNSAKSKRSRDTKIFRYNKTIIKAFKEHEQNQIELEALTDELAKCDMDQTKNDNLMDVYNKVDEVYNKLRPLLFDIEQKYGISMVRLDENYPKKDEEYSTREKIIKDHYVKSLKRFHEDNSLDLEEFVSDVMGFNILKYDNVVDVDSSHVNEKVN